MKKFLVRINLRRREGEREIRNIMESESVDELCAYIEDSYNCQGLNNFEVEKEIYGEEAYRV